VELSGLRTALASSYHDDEPGSPWSFVLYLDERGDDRQREALTEIFLGRLGGTPLKQFPWAWKPSDLLAVRPVAIDVDHTPGRGWFRAGRHVSVRIGGVFEPESRVTCVIPGHHRSGREVRADLIDVDDGGLRFELSGRCGYESTFAYSSSDE
jgi:hypothetical protein